MADLQELMRAVDTLDADEVEQLYVYIQATRTHVAENSQDLLPRVLGLHAHLGKAWMSDDFDAELPDEFWLGEE